MNVLFSRVVTGLAFAGVFLGAFFLGKLPFLFLLMTTCLFIVLVEMPVLTGFLPVQVQFWLSTALYPILPFLLLISWVVQAYKFSVILPFYPFAVGWIADTCGYFVGSFIGKNKLAPTISPRKTWEGFIGSYIGLFIFHVGIAYYFGFAYSYAYLLAVTAAMSTAALIGDLFVSILKRRQGVKDTGTLLPGHGGLLDRFDSVLCIGVLLVLSDLMRNFLR